jgi:pimeloyl-ACP methyl ester carboxylesterase
VTRVPDTLYATTDDGVSIAYQILELESWGNVEIMWELDALADLFERLSQFSRLVLHDRRATGLSGGVSFPNLETRARDLLVVLDAIRSPRAVLFGERTTGAAFTVFAASHPSRAASLVWNRAVATTRWSPEYPWGQTPDEHRAEAAETRGGTGSKELAHGWLTACAPSLAGDERLEAQIARLDRQFMAPSTAAEWIQVESETDVTAVLPLLRCPTLVLDYEQSSTGAAQSRYVQSRIPAWADVIRRHNTIVREALERWQGVENDTAGDGFYATFDGPARAIRCALDIVSRVGEVGLEVRAGIHTGECEVVDGKRAGLAVTIGSRIAAIAGPRDVLVSRTVKDLTAGSGFSFEGKGEHELKGVPEHWQLYRVVPEG